jgi:hypothetical protein
MKKVLIIFTLLLFGIYANAQRVNSFWGTANDTLDASVVKTQVIPIGTNEWKDFSVTVFTDSVSGTPAFTAKIEYSLDGTNYFAIESAADVTHTGGADKSLAWLSKGDVTYSVSGDTTTIFLDSPVLAKYLKITLTATATAQQSLCYGYYIITAYKED